METGNDHEKDQDVISQQELEQEIEWMRRLLALEEKEIPLPESLRSQHLLAKIKDVVPDPPRQDSPFAVSEFPAQRTGEEKKKSKTLFFKLASCAACLALVLFGWRQLSDGGAMITQKPAGMPERAASSAASAEMAAAMPAAGNPEAQDTIDTAELAADTALLAAPQTALVELPEQPLAAGYDEVYQAVSDIYQKRNQPRPRSYPSPSVGDANRFTVESPVADMAPAAPVNPTTAGSGNSKNDAGVFSTNVQVEGIDESDLIKTDGVYLYHYRFDGKTGGAEVSIVAANGLKLLSTIELADFTDAELYVSGDRLILVQTAGEERVRELLGTLERAKADSRNASSELIVPDYVEPQGEQEPELIDMVETVVYDLADRKNPKEVGRYQQDGRYVSSRLSGDTLYLVTNKNLYRFYPDGGPVPLPRYLPIMGENGKAEALDAGNILLPPYQESLNYAVVSALSLSAGARETKAVLGMADQIMMSGDALCLTASISAEGGDASWWNRTDTGVTRFVVTDGALGYLSSGRVPGLIDNQFSLDEYQGNLRIATTSRNEQGEPVNNVFVYNQKMEKLGGVENLAPGEQIYSVRFLGNTAYLVTWRQVDPLFVIDLSNPKRPVVKGELKIPGFSEYLHPIDQNTLLGFGRNTLINQWGGSSEDGLKLSLFDVSNPTDPKEITSYLLGNSGSESVALENHKAFLYDPQNKLIGFPATIHTSEGASISRPWGGSSDVTFSGYLLFTVTEDGFELAATLPSEGGGVAEGFHRTDPAHSIDRGVYIGKTFYTIANGRIRAYSLDDFKQIGELAY